MKIRRTSKKVLRARVDEANTNAIAWHDHAMKQAEEIRRLQDERNGIWNQLVQVTSERDAANIDAAIVISQRDDLRRALEQAETGITR